jgi:signal transduction histidine kinase
MPITEPRYLAALEQLLAIEALTLSPALDAASDVIATALSAEKVDAFVYEEATNTLVALGTSHTPMGRLQISLGLDRLPIANGGRAVEVFQTGRPFKHGNAAADTGELLGIREGLGVLSSICTPLNVNGVRRGVVQATSDRRDAFADADMDFLTVVAKWVGLVFHRSELVEQLTRETEKTSRQLAAEEIVTVLAHDLRNQLSPLMNRAMILFRMATRDGHPEYADESLRITERLQRLSSFLTDLLDVARLEHGLFALDRQHLELGALVTEAVLPMESPSATFEVRAAEEVVAFVDSKRLRQALENLLSNARRHAAGSPVTIDIGREKRERGDVATISIMDQGPGIPPHLIPRLTEPFVRGGTDRGLGIGLYLVRGIVEAHGGALEVESTLEVGSTFRMVIPLDAERSAALA